MAIWTPGEGQSSRISKLISNRYDERIHRYALYLQVLLGE
jgi:hypothetical protein